MGIVPYAQVDTEKASRAAEMAQKNKSNRYRSQPIERRQMIGFSGFKHHRFRTQSSVKRIGVPPSTTSKSVTFRACISWGPKSRSAYFAVVSASLCAVRAMLPPSERNMPYF